MSNSSRRSYVVAILLSFFLGGLGVDRFYMGYIAGRLHYSPGDTVANFMSWHSPSML